jgi:hypothetical protein
MQVRSKHLTEVVIHLYAEGKNEAGGKMFRRTGESITLKPGINDVDSKFMEKWFEQNKNSTILEKV